MFISSSNSGFWKLCEALTWGVGKPRVRYRHGLTQALGHYGAIMGKLPESQWLTPPWCTCQSLPNKSIPWWPKVALNWDRILVRWLHQRLGWCGGKSVAVTVGALENWVWPETVWSAREEAGCFKQLPAVGLKLAERVPSTVFISFPWQRGDFQKKRGH